jgi:hypothetical protein
VTLNATKEKNEKKMKSVSCKLPHVYGGQARET